MCFLLEMVIFHYYVSLPEGTLHITNLEPLFDLYFWTQKQGRTSKGSRNIYQADLILRPWSSPFLHNHSSKKGTRFHHFLPGTPKNQLQMVVLIGWFQNFT